MTKELVLVLVEVIVVLMVDGCGFEVIDSNATVECLASLLDPLLPVPLSSNKNLDGLQMLFEAFTSLSVL